MRRVRRTFILAIGLLVGVVTLLFFLFDSEPAGVVQAVRRASRPTHIAAASTIFRPPEMHTGGIYAGPPVKLLLLGDSTAFTLGIGLSAYQKDYKIEEFNGGIFGCGVAEGASFQLQGVEYAVNSHCSGNDDTEQWPQVWRDEIQTIHPSVVMILAGRLEVMNRTYEGGWTDILEPGYSAYVAQQLTLAVDMAGSGGAHVVLLTAPCYDTGKQPDGQPWPEDSPQRLAKYNRIVRSVAAATRSSLVDFGALACPDGRYQSLIDGFDARYDGVHFTLGGGVVFEPELFPIAEKLGRGDVHERQGIPR